MKKLVAFISVISWAGFWAFGFLALSANIENTGQIITAVILAGIGLITGTVTYLRISKGYL